jgi:hypothetical protein
MLSPKDKRWSRLQLRRRGPEWRRQLRCTS